MSYKTTAWIGWTVLLLGVAVPVNDGFAQSDSDYARKAVALAKKKDYAGAAEQFSLAIKASPKTAKHYSNRGKAYRAAGQLEKAEADFTKVLELSPDNADAFSERGKVKVSEKKYDEGIADLTKAIALDENDIDSFRFRAFAYAAKEEFEKAIEDYGSVLEAKANDKQALERRGFAYRSAKKYDEAIADFTTLIEKAPKDAEAYKRRGYAYSLKGEKEKAVADFKMAVKLKPGDADAAARLKALEGKPAASADSSGAGCGGCDGRCPAVRRRPVWLRLRAARRGADFSDRFDGGARGIFPTGNCFDTRKRAVSLPTLFAGTKRSQGRSNCEV